MFLQLRECSACGCPISVQLLIKQLHSAGVWVWSGHRHVRKTYHEFLWLGWYSHTTTHTWTMNHDPPLDIPLICFHSTFSYKDQFWLTVGIIFVPQVLRGVRASCRERRGKIGEKNETQSSYIFPLTPTGECHWHNALRCLNSSIGMIWFLHCRRDGAATRPYSYINRYEWDETTDVPEMVYWDHTSKYPRMDRRTLTVCVSIMLFLAFDRNDYVLFCRPFSI